MPELNKNAKIKGYTLKDYLGAGQFGEVWLAHDTKGGNDVAIKFYVSLDEKGRKEFFDEYKLASTLQQDNLLRVSHLGEYSRRPYMVMDYCEKGPASNLVGTLAPKDEEVIWRFVHDVAAGLRHLHANNIVHQDIKPDNILQASDGRFVIADFGISTNVRATMRKQSGRINNAGSVAYMPPEKFKSDSQIIKAGDLWALGVSIYELAVGKLPFAGQGGVMQLNGAEMPEIVSKGYSKKLNTVMQRCLQKETWDRFTAESLLEFTKIKEMENERVLEGEHKLDKQRETIRTKKIEDTTPQPIGNAKPNPKRKIALIVGLTLLAVVVLSIVFVGKSINPDELSVSGTASGHDYVDLGLPSGTLWATTNVGASNPWDYGDYFAWGETTTKSKYDWSTLKYCEDTTGYKFSKYYSYTDTLTTLEKSDDAAAVNWGSDWCMPTLEQIYELDQKCTWNWTSCNGNKGYEVIGPNGNRFFLPAAGSKGRDGRTSDVGSYGYYWSSSLRRLWSYSGGVQFEDLAHTLYFYSSSVFPNEYCRSFGFPVRPVRCR